MTTTTTTKTLTAAVRAFVNSAVSITAAVRTALSTAIGAAALADVLNTEGTRLAKDKERTRQLATVYTIANRERRNGSPFGLYKDNGTIRSATAADCAAKAKGKGKKAKAPQTGADPTATATATDHTAAHAAAWLKLCALLNVNPDKATAASIAKVVQTAPANARKALSGQTTDRAKLATARKTAAKTAAKTAKTAKTAQRPIDNAVRRQQATATAARAAAAVAAAAHAKRISATPTPAAAIV